MNITIGKEESIIHPHELAMLFEDKPKHYKVAIRNFLKFLIERGYYTKSQLVDFQAVIKIPKPGIRPASEAFTTTDKIIKALEEVKNKKKKLMIKLLAYTGLRLSETVDLLNNFDKKELTIKDKIAKYDLMSMYRRIGSRKAKAEQTKRAFIAYMPAKFAAKLHQMKVTQRMFEGKKLANGIIYANQLRKWHAEFLSERDIKESIIEFIQGKTPEKILRKHYLDLEKQADKAYEKIVDEFPF